MSFEFMENNTMEHQLVVFELANELYGINIAVVESIIKMQSITQLPQTPTFIKGVTNLRGAVLPVIDLRLRFGLEPRPDTKQTRVIIVTMGKVKVGIMVDGVSEVLHVSDEIIEPLPAMVNSVNSDFLKGIVRFDDRLIILLEVEMVLDLQEHQSIAELPVMVTA
jgi:purine-binding chemotaxis protein CheW